MRISRDGRRAPQLGRMVAAFAMLVIAAVPSSGQAPADPGPELTKAREALANGDLRTARKQFQRLRKASDPPSSDALIGLAQVELVANNVSKAQGWAEQAVEATAASPDSVGPRWLLATIHERAMALAWTRQDRAAIDRHRLAAREQLEQVVSASDPPFLPAWIQLAWLYYDEGASDRARQLVGEYFAAGAEARTRSQAERLRCFLGATTDEEPTYVKPPEISKPITISNPPPQLTLAARKAGYSGRSTVQAVVGANGRVTCARVLSYAPYGLDQAALDALARWRWEPARRQGEAVPVVFFLTVSFNS